MSNAPADTGSLPPGPAFIQWDPKVHGNYVMPGSVPRGYIWQPATEGTAAGWVRPMGKAT